MSASVDHPGTEAIQEFGAILHDLGHPCPHNNDRVEKELRALRLSLDQLTLLLTFFSSLDAHQLSAWRALMRVMVEASQTKRSNVAHVERTTPHAVDTADEQTDTGRLPREGTLGELLDGYLQRRQPNQDGSVTLRPLDDPHDLNALVVEAEGASDLHDGA